MLTVEIRVKPGAARTAVGGDYDGRLVVTVQARAIEGQATEAALSALAKALGVRRRNLTLLRGVRSRDKVVGIDDPPPDCAQRIAQLRR